MKRIIYLLLASVALVLCSCSVNAPEAVTPAASVYSIPKELRVCVQEPQTRMSIGELDPASGTYPINLTPYDYEKYTGDAFYFWGGRGDIADFIYENLTMQGVYRVECVRGNVSTIVLQGVPEAFKEEFDASDYFILTNDSAAWIGQGENGEIGPGIVLANWFTKEEVLRMIDGLSDESDENESVLKLYPLTSLLKLHVTFPQMDSEKELTEVIAYTPGTYPRKSVDFSRLPQMIAEKTVYGYSTSDYTYTILSQNIVHSGEEMDIYISLDPGHYDAMTMELDLADSDFTYDVRIDAKHGFEIVGGNMYTTSLTISKEQMMACRELIPVLAVGNKSFWFSDPDNENALPLKKLLETTPVVLAGYGQQTDFETGVDAMGKVAVVSRGQISFSDKIINAKNAGAVGIIIYNNQPGEVYMDISNLIGTNHIPAIATTQEFGQYLSEHAGEKVSIWTNISEMENANGN